MSDFLDTTGLGYVWSKIKSLLANKVDKVSGKGLSTNDYTSAEKTKLAGIATGANNYTHPAYTARTSGLYKITVNSLGHVTAVSSVTASDLPDLSGEYLPLAGGTMTGTLDMTNANSYIKMPNTAATIQQDSTPWAGAIEHTGATIADDMPSHRTFAGSYLGSAGTWYNLLSIRHRNGYGDGTGYGMYMYCPLTSTGDIKWRQQINSTTWTSVKTLLDSTNYLPYTHSQTRTDITGQTVDLNSYTQSGGTVPIHRYICRTIGGANNITNKPTTAAPFLLDVELIRWASTTDYITMQTYRTSDNKAAEFVRYCTSGTWSAWTTRVFTDTKPTDSGWVSLPAASSAITATTIQYRKYGKQVEIRGTVTSAGGGGITCGTLPTGYRPSTTIRTVCASAGTAPYGVQVLSSGVLNIFSSPSSSTFFASGTAYTVCIQFMVD